MSWRLLRLGLALGACGALVGLVHPTQLLAALAEAEPRWLLLAFVLLLTSTGIGMLGFRSVLAARGLTAPLGAILATDLAGYFYALTVPAGIATGGAVRVLRLAGPGMPASSVVGGIVASRLIDILANSLLALAVLPWIAALLPAPMAWSALVGGLVAAVLLAIAAVQNGHLRLRLAVLLLRLPAPRRWRRRRRRLALALGRARPANLAAHLPALACAFARHLVGAAAVLALAWAVHADLAYGGALWARTITSIAMLLPLTLAGIGLREASMVLLLLPFGVPAAQALALSLPLLGFQLLLAAIGGGIELGTSLAALRRSGRPVRREGSV